MIPALFMAALVAMLGVAGAMAWADEAPIPWVARVYSGPTEARRRISMRLELLRGRSAPDGVKPDLPVSLRATDRQGQATEWTGRFQGGFADPVLGFRWPTKGPLRVEVRVDGETAALGDASVTDVAWRAAQVLHGGWLEARRSGGLRIEAAVAKGVLAVPFPGWLLLRVTSDGLPAPARLTLRGDGIGLGLLGADELTTDAEEHGTVRVLATPREVVAALTVDALSAEARGEWQGVLPVTLGAAMAVAESGRLTFRAPVCRERLFYAVVSEAERWSGGSVELQPTADGQGQGSIPWTAPPGQPWWVVVSSEPGLTSGSTQGWQVVARDTTLDEPARSLVQREPLVLDGRSFVKGVVQRRRQRGLFCSAVHVLLTVLGTVAFAAVRLRISERRLEKHFTSASDGDRSIAGIPRARRPRGVFVLFILCLVLGYAGLALWLFWGIG